MSGISSGIGLISGINTSELIDQLIAIEARPIRNLEQRVETLDARRAAFLELSAQLLAVRNAVANFNKISFFRRFNSTSTNEGVVTAVAGENAVPGSTTLRVHSLVSNHSLVTRGFADANRTPVGAGTITIEVGNGRVDRPTELNILNGGNGIRRGVITITDATGATTDIDLRTALTVEDILSAINSNPNVQVRARVTGLAHTRGDGTVAQGDRIVIEDMSGGTGELIVADKAGGFAAADLGIAGRTAAGRIDGHDLLRVTMNTPLSLLNDGNGVGRFRQGPDLTFSTAFGNFNVSLTDLLLPETDLRLLNNGEGVRTGMFRITDRAGNSVDVDLTDLDTSSRVTAQQVRERIGQAAEAAGVNISVTMVNSSFLITDTSDVPEAERGNLIVEDISGSAAADLGIIGDVDGEAIFGRPVYRVATVGDVIRTINLAPENQARVEASLAHDGFGITLRALGFDNTVTVQAGQDGTGITSTAARDLGLLDASFSTNEPFTSRRLLAGLNTVLLQSLRGGSGLETGTVSFTDSLGQSTTIDFSTATTLADVIDLINADGTTGLVASLNPAGNGITLRDESGGSEALTISDVSGSMAEALGIAGTFPPSGDQAVTTVNGGKLQLKYISRQTALSTLNGNRGVSLGRFQVSDSTGGVHLITPPANATTVGEIIDAINRAGGGAIEARINNTGDGIAVIDNTEGTQTLTIEDLEGGSLAEDLRLAGEAVPGQTAIDGSSEIRIDVSAGDTLQDLARKMNEADPSLSAAVIHDGSGVNPFSLTLTSAVSGRRGELVIDVRGPDLGLATLTRPRDAVVTVGSDGSGGGKLITSPTNQLDGVVEDVTFDLLAVSDEPVTVNVGQDLDSVVESIQAFVEKYNDVQDAIDKATSFNAETFDRGPLFGDRTVDTVRSRLARVIMDRVGGVDESVSRPFAVGLRIGSGNRLEFDEDEFREVYERAPELVEDFFTTGETGFGTVLQETLDGLTRDFDGLIARKNELLSDRQELLNRRIDSLNVLLDAKRARLESQFVGLESALAALQSQQNSLSVLAQLASSGQA